jgi:vancomycin resistance protein YoaR
VTVDGLQHTGPQERHASGDNRHNQDEPLESGAAALPEEGYTAEQRGPSARPTRSRPRRRVGWRRRQAWLVRLLLAFLLLVALGAGGAWYYASTTFTGQIYPNISIQGLPVGTMTPSQAMEAIHNQYTPFLNQPIILTYGEQTWTPTPAELGIEIEAHSAVDRAFQIGRSVQTLDSLREIGAVWQSGVDVPLSVRVDQQAMQRYLASIAPQIEQPAVDAQVVLNGTVADTMHALQGRQLLVDETVRDMTAALQTLAPQTIAIRTRTIAPLVSDTEAAEAQRTIDTLLQAPVTLTADEQTWELGIHDIARMIRVERQPQEDSDSTHEAFTITLDKHRLRERLEDIADSTHSGYTLPRLEWNGGDLAIIEEGQPGLRVDVARAERMILDALETSDRTIELPFTMAEPPVNESNLDKLGITELVSVGRSDFTGSAAYRITNIQAGMKQFHGLLIAPDEEFSFNQSVGRIDASNGFVEGYAIVSKRTQLEWGGGICQDSTTMFRAAFWAGLPITERWGHSFYISWYDKYGYGDYGDGPGMDATIFTGGPDLKFVNDTGHWLLIQTHVDTSKALAEIRFYGTRPDRTVTLAKGSPEIFNRTPAPSAPVYVPDPRRPRGSPRRSDTARGGMDIAFTRVISQNGVEVERERFMTRFKPWPNIYEVHPADLPYYEGRGDSSETEETPTPAEGTPIPEGEGAEVPPEPTAEPPAQEPVATPTPMAPPSAPTEIPFRPFTDAPPITDQEEEPVSEEPIFMQPTAPPPPPENVVPPEHLIPPGDGNSQ